MRHLAICALPLDQEAQRFAGQLVIAIAVNSPRGEQRIATEEPPKAWPRGAARREEPSDQTDLGIVAHPHLIDRYGSPAKIPIECGIGCLRRKTCVEEMSVVVR